MQKFIGIKAVQAGKIIGIHNTDDPLVHRLSLEGGKQVHAKTEWLTNKEAVIGGYIVEYPDGYRSFSPADVFEKAYMQTSDSYFMDNHGVLTVQGDTGEVFFRIKPTTDGRCAVALGYTDEGEEMGENGENIKDYFQVVFMSEDVCRAFGESFEMAARNIEQCRELAQTDAEGNS